MHSVELLTSLVKSLLNIKCVHDIQNKSLIHSILTYPLASLDSTRKLLCENQIREANCCSTYLQKDEESNSNITSYNAIKMEEHVLN